MFDKDTFDGYTVSLRIDEDGDWLARFVEMPTVSAAGDTPDDALTELQLAWDAMKASFLKHGEEVPIAPGRKEYSGQFNVRIDKRLHRELVLEAFEAGISLNALVAQKLATAVAGLHKM